MVIFEQIHDTDLSKTFDCGQSFRWNALPDGSFSGVAFGRSVRVFMQNNSLFIDGAEEGDRALWHSYFDLGTDYGAVGEQLSRLHPVLRDAADFSRGIRILRQEPFEALVSFIISQNNNIPRIKGIVSRLCEGFGEPLGDGQFAFPSAETLSCCTAEDLAPLRAGFRARYILDAARKVAGGEVDLDACRTLDYEAARAALMKITGVGVKVADCTLLYGMHRLEAFPMDVWMKRATATLLPGVTPADFGGFAGIAQQFIFHYSRSNPSLFEAKNC